MRTPSRASGIKSAAVTAILALVVAGPSFAASLPFAGDLGIEIETFPTIGVAGGGIARINGSANAGHLSSLSIDADAFQASHVEVPVDILGSPIVGMLLTAANPTRGRSPAAGAPASVARCRWSASSSSAPTRVRAARRSRTSACRSRSAPTRRPSSPVQ